MTGAALVLGLAAVALVVQLTLRWLRVEPSSPPRAERVEAAATSVPVRPVPEPAASQPLLVRESPASSPSSPPWKSPPRGWQVEGRIMGLRPELPWSSTVIVETNPG